MASKNITEIREYCINNKISMLDFLSGKYEEGKIEKQESICSEIPQVAKEKRVHKIFSKKVSHYNL